MSNPELAQILSLLQKLTTEQEQLSAKVSACVRLYLTLTTPVAARASRVEPQPRIQALPSMAHDTNTRSTL